MICELKLRAAPLCCACTIDVQLQDVQGARPRPLAGRQLLQLCRSLGTSARREYRPRSAGPVKRKVFFVVFISSSVADPGSSAFFFLTPGSEARIIFLGAQKQFFWQKILKFLVADPDLGSEIFLTMHPGSGKKKFETEIRDQHPASATLIIQLFLSVTDKMPTKYFFALYFLKVHLHQSSKIDSQKEVKK